MSRSFGIVEWKLREADFFLDKIETANDMLEAEFYLSAFLSSARAVTFAIEAALRHVDGFDAWYSMEQDDLRKAQRWFAQARNASQKEGASFVQSSERSADGRRSFFIDPLLAPGGDAYERLGQYVLERLTGQPEAPRRNLADLCRRHVEALAGIVKRCFERFGTHIDAEQYYTIENMHRLGTSIEDLEAELGIPRGQTEGVSVGTRLSILCERAGLPEIDDLLVKYLGVDRFGHSPPSNDETK